MANPWAGEVELTLDGKPHTLKLTLGALAELEAAMQADSLVDLVRRFEERRFTTRDVVALIVAGLRGGGWRGTAQGPRRGRNRGRSGGRGEAAGAAPRAGLRAAGMSSARLGGADAGGAGGLGLRPEEFWRLTPVEFLTARRRMRHALAYDARCAGSAPAGIS